jgi:host factor-I protein
MKDTLEPIALDGNADEQPSAAERPKAGQQDGFSNRKLIRPSLSSRHEKSERPDRAERSSNGKKAPPPNQTYAENFYYQKQMQSRTPMVVTLTDGEEIRGVIEWYDENCIKVNRNGSQANLLIYKSSIKYVFKEAESNGRK